MTTLPVVASAPSRSAAPIADRDSDADLVRRAQRGEREALVVLYRRYVNEIFGYVYGQLGDAQDAEDITSETFVRLVAALDTFDHRSSFRTWLYAVARNQLRDRWRARSRQPVEVALDDGTVSAEGQASPTGDSPWAARGRQVMAALPEHYRTVLTLRVAHGRSIRDVAEAMGTTPGNVKVLQHRALKRAAAIAAALDTAGDAATLAPNLVPERRHP